MQADINEALVRQLIAAQFPQWASLPVRPVANSGWDNRTFHLGEHLLVRLPSAACYEGQVEKEQQWLPLLAPLLPLPIPTPMAVGLPGQGYPWKWSVYGWIEGDAVSATSLIDMPTLVADLAKFLAALQHIDARDGPAPGAHNFHRGGALATCDAQTRQALALLKDRIDTNTAAQIWVAALATAWQQSAVWVHGDIHAANLLVRDGRLCAVLDFGQLGVGDPACDLAVAWTLFEGASRDAFRAALALDAGTWARGRGWALWKAMILAAGVADGNAADTARCWRVIGEVLADHERMT
jgi:aminoglycoside phosphotransferase (APT) family kinase protein